MISDLKVFQKTYDLLLYMYPILQKYPKSERFSLRQRMENSLLCVLKDLIAAHYLREKREPLEHANLELEKLRIFLRLSYDLKFLDLRRFEICSRQLNEIGKMVGGWIRV